MRRKASGYEALRRAGAFGVVSPRRAAGRPRVAGCPFRSAGASMSRRALARWRGVAVGALLARRLAGAERGLEGRHQVCDGSVRHMLGSDDLAALRLARDQLTNARLDLVGVLPGIEGGVA